MNCEFVAGIWTEVPWFVAEGIIDQWGLLNYAEIHIWMEPKQWQQHEWEAKWSTHHIQLGLGGLPMKIRPY